MKRFAKLLVLIAWIVSLPVWADGFAEYKKQIGAMSDQIDPHHSGNGPADLTFRDYSRLRAGYKKMYELTLKAASDDDLDQNEKFKVLELIANDLGHSMEKITEPYVDVEVPEQIVRERGENIWSYSGRMLWSNLAFAGKSTVRDLGTGFNISDGRGNYSGGAWVNNVSASWNDIKRSIFLKGTAKDLKKLYKVELKVAKREKAYNAKLAALANLVQEYHEQKIEPIRYGAANRYIGRIYLFMGYAYWYFFPYHDVVANLPPFWGERTKYTGLMSVALGAAGWSLLYMIRQGNSGVGFFKTTESIFKMNEKALKQMSPLEGQVMLCDKLMQMSGARGG